MIDHINTGIILMNYYFLLTWPIWFFNLTRKINFCHAIFDDLHAMLRLRTLLAIMEMIPPIYRNDLLRCHILSPNSFIFHKTFLIPMLCISIWTYGSCIIMYRRWLSPPSIHIWCEKIVTWTVFPKQEFHSRFPCCLLNPTSDPMTC